MHEINFAKSPFLFSIDDKWKMNTITDGKISAGRNNNPWENISYTKRAGRFTYFHNWE